MHFHNSYDSVPSGLPPSARVICVTRTCVESKRTELQPDSPHQEDKPKSHIPFRKQTKAIILPRASLGDG